MEVSILFFWCLHVWACLNKMNQTAVRRHSVLSFHTVSTSLNVSLSFCFAVGSSNSLCPRMTCVMCVCVQIYFSGRQWDVWHQSEADRARNFKPVEVQISCRGISYFNWNSHITLGDVSDKLNILARLQSPLQFSWVSQQQRMELILTSSPSRLQLTYSLNNVSHWVHVTLSPMKNLFAAVTAGDWGGAGVFVWVDALLEINTEYRGHLLSLFSSLNLAAPCICIALQRHYGPALRAVSISRALPCTPTATAASTVILGSNIKGHERLMGLV